MNKILSNNTGYLRAISFHLNDTFFSEKPIKPRHSSKTPQLQKIQEGKNIKADFIADVDFFLTKFNCIGTKIDIVPIKHDFGNGEENGLLIGADMANYSEDFHNFFKRLFTPDHINLIMDNDYHINIFSNINKYDYVFSFFPE